MCKPLAVLLGVAIFGAIFPRLSAQDPAQFGPGQIYVDQWCRTFIPDPSSAQTGPRYHSDRYVCHFESPHSSVRREDYLKNGVVKHRWVRIDEKEYLLSGPPDAPVTFYIEQPLPQGGRVDSDPQPVSIENGVAVFQVQAEPGQTVRLHIGIRY
jgi:hypothetical protein